LIIFFTGDCQWWQPALFSKIIRCATLLLVLILGMGQAAPIAAQSDPVPNRAGLVVVHEDGSVVSRCVGFDEESISGYDLLVRGGFAPRAEVTGMGTSVCSLEGKGCGEGENCFCQCQSSPCIYWTYWQLGPEGWRYFNMGASSNQVSDGAVQGWRWGESKPNAPAEIAPPLMTFADICAADAVVYGIEDAIPAASRTGIGAEPWLVALVVAVPLLLGAGWWLLQRRRVVQP
jgi:hypothetical protein